MKVKNELFNGRQYQLRGLATLPDYRGQGAGKLMMEPTFSILKELNVACLWCNARIIALDFYKKMGLQTIGEEFDVPPTGDHYVMFKYLNDSN